MREPHPQSPRIPVSVPNPPDALAKATLHQMTIDPDRVTPEMFLLAAVEKLDLRVQNLEKASDRIELALVELNRSHSNLGWKVSGALASAMGALLAAAWTALKPH